LSPTNLTEVQKEDNHETAVLTPPTPSSCDDQASPPKVPARWDSQLQHGEELPEVPIEASAPNLSEGITSLEERISISEGTLERENQILRERLNKADKKNKQLLEALEKEVEKRIEVMKDNAMLRSQIVNMQSPRNPTYDDGYYVQNLQQLNESMKSWVAAAFKSKEVEYEFSKQDELKIVELLDRRPFGKSLLMMIQHSQSSIRKIYYSPRIRMAFVRSLISLFMWEYIFVPFCFGMPREMRRATRNIMESVCRRGYVFLISLMV
jgi:hypothetical protein